MTSPYFSDAFLGGGGLSKAEDEALLPATIQSSSLAMPGDRALDASLRSPGALSPDQTPGAGLTASAAQPLMPDQATLARAAAAIAPQGPPPAVSIQDAAAAQVAAPAPVPVAAPAKPVAKGGGGPGLPYGSQTEEHLGAMRDANEADLAANRAQQVGLINHADLLDAQTDAREQRMVERDARKAQRDQALDQHMADLDARITDASSQAYDSGKFFASPGTMMMNIGAALGGGAAARVTGRNDAQAVLERGLDRDFQQWKANAEQKQSGVREKANLVTQMRAVYGDRDQADLAAEAIHKEMAAAAIEAQAARSKVPEIQAAGQKLAAGLREGVAGLKDKIRAGAAAAYAAAEARRRADEKENFERGLKLAELGVKQKDADTKRLEAEGKGGKDINEQTGKLASALTSAKIPTALASAERAKADLAEGGSALNSNAVSNAFAEKFPLIYKFVAGDAAAASQMSFANFKNEILSAKGGAAISDSELARHLQAIQGAGTPADKQRAIADVVEALKKGEAAIKAGASDEARAEYERRERALAPTVSATAPKNFTPGIR